MYRKSLKFAASVLAISALVGTANAATRQEDGTVRGVDVGTKTIVLEEHRYLAESPLVIHNMNDDSSALTDLSKLAVGTPIRVSIDQKNGQDRVSEIWILRGDHSEVD